MRKLNTGTVLCFPGLPFPLPLLRRRPSWPPLLEGGLDELADLSSVIDRTAVTEVVNYYKNLQSTMKSYQVLVDTKRLPPNLKKRFYPSAPGLKNRKSGECSDKSCATTAPWLLKHSLDDADTSRDSASARRRNACRTRTRAPQSYVLHADNMHARLT